MQHNDILKLSACVPPVRKALREDAEQSVEMSLSCGFLRAYLKPDYGWETVQSLVMHEMVFPFYPDGALQWLWLAYAQIKGMVPDRSSRLHPVRYAWHIRTHPSQSSVRGALEGAMVIKGATAEKAAKLLGLDPDVVRAYDALFWNVLDRGKDLSYLQSVIYPYGRVEEMLDDHFLKTNALPIIRRIGYNNYEQDLSWISGLRFSPVDALTIAEAKEQTERLTMSNGLMFLRNFGNYSKQHVAVHNARALLQAAKLGGVDEGHSAGDDHFSAVIEAELGADREGLQSQVRARMLPAT